MDLPPVTVRGKRPSDAYPRVQGLYEAGATIYAGPEVQVQVIRIFLKEVIYNEGIHKPLRRGRGVKAYE